MLNKVMSLTKYLKKRKKIGKHLITFSVILSSLFIIGNVKASGIEDVQKYAPKITDENIQLFFEKNNIDTSIYDTYIITVYDSYTYSGILNDYKEVEFFWFNYQDYLDGTIKIDNVLIAAEKSYRYRIRFNSAKNGFGTADRTRTSSGSYSISNFPNINYSFYNSNSQGFAYLVLGKPDNVTKLEPLAYYTNKDIYLVDGTLWLKANANEGKVYEQDIDVTKVEKIEFKYKLPQNISQNVNLKYEITNSLDGEEYYFPSPYFDEEYTYCNSETQTCSPKTQHRYFELYDTDPDNILVRNYLPNYFNYTDSIYSSSSSSERYDKLLNRVKLSSRYYVKSFDYLLNADTEYTVENLTMVLDFSLNYQPITAHVKVSSSVDFDVVIHYRSDEDSSSNYYKIVDITGKYGAIFLPKVDLNIEGDASYKSLFKVTGDVEFQQRDSRIFKNSKVLRAYTTNLNSKVCNEKNNSPSSSSNLNDFSSSNLLTDTFPYGCSKSGLFEIYINNKMLQQSIVVINNNYSVDMTAAAAIIYDSRYYNYAIYDTSYDKKTIIDPTTGEEVEISISDFKKDNTDMDPDLIRSTIKTFLKPISYITNSINNFYTNYMPQPLQQFLYFIFGLTVIIIVIKIIF